MAAEHRSRWHAGGAAYGAPGRRTRAGAGKQRGVADRLRDEICAYGRGTERGVDSGGGGFSGWGRDGGGGVWRPFRGGRRSGGTSRGKGAPGLRVVVPRAVFAPGECAA